MKSEWKWAMQYMWGSKTMRRTFFCGFDLLGNGGILLVIALAMVVPLATKLLGVDIGMSTCRWIYMLAFMGQILIQELVVEIPMIHQGATGKTIGGVPFAKWIMTKGLIVNELIYYVCSFGLMVGIYGIGMVVGAMDGSLLDDILFFTGLFFFLDNVFRVIVGVFRKDIQSGSVVFISAVTATISREMGEIHLSLGWSVFWHVIFMVSGVLLLYLFLVRRYKRRSSVVS